MFVIKLMTSPKGEGQGPFRMGPHRPPPYTPTSLHPASDSLAEGGQRRLPKGNPLFLGRIPCISYSYPY